MTDPVFFEPSRRFSVAEIAAVTGAELTDPARADDLVTHVASLQDGGVGALVYLNARKRPDLLVGLTAAALICSAEAAPHAPQGIAVLVSTRPQADFAVVARLLFPDAVHPVPLTGETGLSPHAFIDASASIEAGAVIEAGVVIGARAAVGRGTVVAPNAVIGANCRIGRDCYIGPSVTIQNGLIGNGVLIHAGARIGQDGFGYVAGARGPEKIPQIGRVVIQDNVEIGANTTVDRGALGDTVIGEGTKIDNLVQVAHNVQIGRFCIIAGHCGLSGSVTVGDGAMLGGRVGLADHVTVGAGAQVAAASGVMHDVPPGGRWGGIPAQPLKEYLKQHSIIKNLAKNRRKQGPSDE